MNRLRDALWFIFMFFVGAIGAIIYTIIAIGLSVAVGP